MKNFGINRILIAPLIALFVACGPGGTTASKPAGNAPNTVASPISSPSPTPSPESPTAKKYDGRGVVTKIDLKLVSVELDHEEIKGLMPAMRMEFYVKEKSELEVLKVGDTVEFVLEDDRGQERIISIRKAK